MGLAKMFALMTIESIARFVADRTGLTTKQLRVIRQAHRVNTSDTMKSHFELGKSLTVGPIHMLTGVLESVSQRTRKAGSLTVGHFARRFIQLLRLDENTASPISRLANAYPRLEKFLVRNVRTDVNAVSVKIRVVLFLVCVPTAKFIAPEKQELARRDS